MRAEAGIDASDTRLVFSDYKKVPCFMHFFCMVPECDATHARHANDPLSAHADTIRGARPPKNNFQWLRRLRVAQADLRKTAQTIQQHRPRARMPKQEEIRIVAAWISRCGFHRRDRSIGMAGHALRHQFAIAETTPAAKAAGADDTGAATRRRISDRLPRAVRRRHPDRAVR